MKCTECCYYWKEENEDRACCHWVAHCAGDIAPCEYEDEPQDEPEDWEEPEFADDEMGFDPYEGCYTWDC